MNATQTDIRTEANEAMTTAGAYLAKASGDCVEEANWIGRNELGNDAAYLLASIASRRAEIDAAYKSACRELDQVRSVIAAQS